MGWEHNDKPSKGPGWGGPAKGWRQPPAFTSDNQPPPHAKVAGRDRAGMARLMAQEAVPDAHGVVLKIMAGDLDGETVKPETRLSAALAIINRAEGLPTASVEVRRDPLAGMDDDELADALAAVRSLRDGAEDTGGDGEAGGGEPA